MIGFVEAFAMGMIAQSALAMVVLVLWTTGRIKKLRSGVVMALVLSVVVGVAMVAIVVSFWVLVLAAAAFVAKIVLKGRSGMGQFGERKANSG